MPLLFIFNDSNNSSSKNCKKYTNNYKTYICTVHWEPTSSHLVQVSVRLNRTWRAGSRPGRGRSIWSAWSRGSHRNRSYVQQHNARWGCTSCQTPSWCKQQCPTKTREEVNGIDEIRVQYKMKKQKPTSQLTFSMLYFSRAMEVQSTASCCMSSLMSALLITALRSVIFISDMKLGCQLWIYYQIVINCDCKAISNVWESFTTWTNFFLAPILRPSTKQKTQNKIKKWKYETVYKSKRTIG